jgi:phage terminase large subunit
VLGIEPWDRQAEVLEAIRNHPRVAVRSGHKVGKSTSAAITALWWFTTRKRARVIMTSASYRQVKSILWKELKRLYRESLQELPTKPANQPETGMQHEDGREIVGFSTNEAERMAGISGDEVLFIVDEASGVPEEIFETIEGNRAGGARIVMFSNPTKTVGAFYEAFHTKRGFWHPIHISSEESPNVAAGRVVVPGLATAEWVAEKKREWGVGSPLYDVRVDGNFPSQSENAVISLVLIEAAKEREVESGTIALGVDVARYGDDSSVIQPVAGRRQLPSKTLRTMDGVEVAGKVIEWVREFRAETGYTAPIKVKVDVIGYGSSCYDHLAHSEEAEKLGIIAVAVNVAESATSVSLDDGEGYSRLRDQLWFALRDWLREGQLLDDGPLEAELVAPTYSFDAQGRYKVATKDEIKKVLKRSPDHADALALAVYDPPSDEVDLSDLKFDLGGLTQNNTWGI